MGSRYDEILTEIKNEHSTCIKEFNKFIASSKTKIPLLAEELRKETIDGMKLSNDDIRDRIMKDCLVYWEKWTIIHALPKWAKREYNATEIDAGSQVLGIVMPEEDEKYKYESIKDCTLEVKRAFGSLLKEVTTKEEVTELYHDWAFLEHTIKNVKDRIELTGRAHKAVLKNPYDDKQKQLRKPISVYDLNFTNNDEDIERYRQVFNEDINLIKKQFDDLLNGINRYQIYDLEQMKQMMYSARSLLIVMFNAVSNKTSQSIYQQLETESVARESTEKQAGRQASTKTVVCANCIKKFDPERNDVPPVMQIDNKSNTGLRCPNCLQTEVCERGLTQDIITQRREFLSRVSEHLGSHQPLDFIEIYSKVVKEPIAGTKKVLMSNMLKKSSSFGSTIEDWS